MENIIYFLKQKEHNRVKIGSTTNIQKRVEKLEKDWGKFDDNSELHYFNIDELMKNCLSLDNIEKTIQRIMKLKNQYLDFSIDHEEKDGKTEFFKLDENILKDAFSLFKDNIEKTKYTKDVGIETIKTSIVTPKKKYIEIKKQNESELKAFKSRKSNYIFNNTKKVKDGEGSLRDFINKKQKSINKMKTLISKEILEYSFFNDYNEERISFSISVMEKERKLPEFVWLLIQDLTIFESNNGFHRFMDYCTRLFTDKRGIMRLEFYFQYNDFSGAKLFYIKHIARQILNTFNEKNISKKINFSSKNKIDENIKLKQLYKKCFDNKNIFTIFFHKNNQNEILNIDFNNICEIYAHSEKFEILLLNGKKIEFIHKWYTQEVTRDWESLGYRSLNDSLKQFTNKKIIDENIHKYFFKICRIKYIKTDFR